MAVGPGQALECSFGEITAVFVNAEKLKSKENLSCKIQELGQEEVCNEERM